MHMGGAVVRGIQSQGVVANAKHWVNNNQETDRHYISENVDERTQFELYYPPFEVSHPIKRSTGCCCSSDKTISWLLLLR